MLVFKKLSRIFSFIILFCSGSSFAQNLVIDEVIAVVGNRVILYSDVQNQILQLGSQGIVVNDDMICDIMENILVQKLLINQAAIDSVQISEANVEMQLESRLRIFVNQIGSKEKLEEYFKKSYQQIKDDLRDNIRNQMITQKMEEEITGNIKITPTEVEAFYHSLHEDSIPLINSQIELQQILIKPKHSDEAVFQVRERLLELRGRINNGEKFSTLAKLYSEDPGSSMNGGEIGLLSKGELDPEYAKAAFSLKVGQVSKIVESQFGFHIIQLIERKEDRVNSRHILMKPKILQSAILQARVKLDSILLLVSSDSISFEKAALVYSDDKDTRANGGLVLNQNTNSSKFNIDELSASDYYIIKNLAIGQISEPYLGVDASASQVMKVLRLKSKSNPHKANLKEDYEVLQMAAIENKKHKVLMQWVTEKQRTTYIHLSESYLKCDFESIGWIKK